MTVIEQFFNQNSRMEEKIKIKETKIKTIKPNPEKIKT